MGLELDAPAPPASLVRSNTYGELQQIDQYVMVRQIGEGAYGKVMLAQNSKTKESFAVKVISQTLLRQMFKKQLWLRNRRPARPGAGPPPPPSEDPDNPDNMLKREIAIMKKLNHKNVVKLIEVLQDDKTNDLFLVLEYVSGGTVMPDETECNPISEEKAWEYFRQLIDALDYCHTNGVIHCDIKPANLLVTENGDVKVADFGTSRMMNKSGGSTRDDYYDDTVSKAVGTAAFLSPQACKGGEYSGKALDVWAAGVTLFFMVFGECPFKGPGIATLYENIQTQDLEFPDEPAISEDLKDLLRGMIEKDDKKRFTVKQALNHRWVTKQGEHTIDEEHDVIQITEEDLNGAITLTKRIQSVAQMTRRFMRMLGQAQESIAMQSTRVFDDVDYTLSAPQLQCFDPSPASPQALKRLRMWAESPFASWVTDKHVPTRFNLDLLNEAAEEFPPTTSTNPSSALRAYQDEMIVAAAVHAASQTAPPPSPSAQTRFLRRWLSPSSINSHNSSEEGSATGVPVMSPPATSDSSTSVPTLASTPSLPKLGSTPSLRLSHSMSFRSRVSDGSAKAVSRRKSVVTILKERGVELRDMGMSEEAEVEHISHGLELDLLAKCTYSATAVYDFTSVDTQDVEDADDVPRSSRPDRLLEFVTDYETAYKVKRTDPVVVGERFVAHCRLLAQSSNFITPIAAYNSKATSQHAKRSRVRFQTGDELSVLDGVPVVLGLNIDAKGFPTSDGAGNVTFPTDDAYVAERLRNAGALIVAKARMQELNFGCTGCSKTGPSSNPYQPEFCGGNGCAVAVALGLAPLAVTTDEGGMGRLSAAFCGVVCLKPTFGRISTNGVLAFCPSSNHVVAITRSVTDAAISFAILSGHDVDDSNTYYQPRVIITNFGPGVSLSSTNIGIWPDWENHCDPAVSAVYSTFMHSFSSAVGHVLQIGIHNVDKALASLVVSMSRELWSYVQQTPDPKFTRENLTDAQRLHLALASRLTPEHTAITCRVRTAIMDELKSLFSHFECLVCPAVPCLPPSLALEGDTLKHMAVALRYVFLACITGFPAIVVPVGMSAEAEGSPSFPVACLVMGRPWHESTVLRVARVMEKTRGAALPPPRVWMPMSCNRFSPYAAKDLRVTTDED